MFGMLEQMITSHGDKFVGTWFSTFTSYITRLRAYNGKPDDSNFYYAPPQHHRDFEAFMMPHSPYYPREWPLAWEGIDRPPV